MPSRIIKLGPKDDIVSIVKQIKSLKDSEVIFDVDKDLELFASSNSLRLVKKTGEALGKVVKIQTNDKVGRILAKKEGMLAGNT